MTREQIFEAISAERDYQTDKWGDKFDRKNTPNDWVAYIAQYAGRAVIFPWDGNTFRRALVKVGALVVAALEQDTYAPRHYDLPNASCVETRSSRVG